MATPTGAPSMAAVQRMAARITTVAEREARVPSGARRARDWLRQSPAEQGFRACCWLLAGRSELPTPRDLAELTDRLDVADYAGPGGAPSARIRLDRADHGVVVFQPVSGVSEQFFWFGDRGSSATCEALEQFGNLVLQRLCPAVFGAAMARAVR